MVPTGLILDPCFELHDTGPGHPERPARLERLRRALVDSGLAQRCRTLQPVEATDAQLRLIHDPDYIRRAGRACIDGQTFLDSMDSAICPDSNGFTVSRKRPPCI